MVSVGGAGGCMVNFWLGLFGLGLFWAWWRFDGSLFRGPFIPGPEFGTQAVLCLCFGFFGSGYGEFDC